jgi:ABC-type multidrug transport system ATPase subunit
MQDADFLCDDILLLKAGTVAYSGSIHALVDTGVGIVVAVGEGLDAEFAEALERQGYGIREQYGDRVAFEPNDDRGLHRFWQLAAERGAEVRSLGRELQSLEDAVVHTMKSPGGGDRAR